MLKKSASFVLTSLRGSTYGKEYASASSLSLAAAALDGLFEHPAGYSDLVSDLQHPCVARVPKWFFNSLLVGSRQGEIPADQEVVRCEVVGQLEPGRPGVCPTSV